MSALLRSLERAARRRQDADRAYHTAVRTAREAGHTLAEIGRAAGITKQGARHLLHGTKRGKDA